MNFGGTEIIYDYAASGIVIVPVPYDETSTWMKGADKGPDAILECFTSILNFMILKPERKFIRKVFILSIRLPKRNPRKAC